jgi:Uncharacterized conserved protein
MKCLLGRLFLVFLSVSIVNIDVVAQSSSELTGKRLTLPNGWSLTPAGKSLPLGDLPLNIAVSPNHRLLAVTNNGESDQIVQLIDAKKGVVLDTILMRKSWLGLAFSSSSRELYASGGNDNFVVKFNIQNSKLVPSDTIVLGKPWPEKISVAGIAVDDEHNRLYVVTKDDNSLYVINLKNKQTVKKLPLGGEGYTCLLSPDAKKLFVSCWACHRILVYDTKMETFVNSMAVGSNPNDMCIAPNGHFLYVSNANDNSVSVVDVNKNLVVETLNTALYPDSPVGSTANSVTLDSKSNTLYVANADNNCLAVFDVSKPGTSRSLGFVPTGWYPTCVRIIDQSIFVANGKGYSSYPNPLGPNPAKPSEEVEYQKGGKPAVKEQYIARLLRGKLSIIDIPDQKRLAIYSQVVYANTPYHKDGELKAEGLEGNPIPSRVGDASPIKYVFYVIKENRTYDQVLGDMPQGNGDTSLVLFGLKITPNQHALANEFVLLDNFYADGEVSADGHNWSDGAYATDYLEKTWPTSYGSRGGEYDAEGRRDVANNKDGFIWDFCKRYGVTYRTYGEFTDNYKPNIPVLVGHYCTYFTSWDQHVLDTTRFYQWKRDFDSLLACGSLPRLNTLRFINDHTSGLRRGMPTPFASVADNDLAVGLFVDYLSHSPIWNECAIFIVEDDAQNGPDHVDAHRTTAYVAGGFVKQGFVDHTAYSTSSMLRTIELILGLPPMSQYDAAATPMFRCFNNVATHPPFIQRPETVDLNDLNKVNNKWSKLSDTFDFSKEDRVPDNEFNKVIWAAVKGEDSTCPAPKHAAFVALNKVDDDD